MRQCKSKQTKAFENKLKKIIFDMPAFFGVAISDIKGRFKFLYHENAVFPAASIIKIPILIELLRQAQTGKIKLSKRVSLKNKDKVAGAGVLKELTPGLAVTVLDLATLMIIISDNTATNMVIDLVRMKSVNNTMRRLGLKKSVLGRKLMINPKSLHTKNFVTALEMMVLLKKLYNKEILNNYYTRLAFDILSKQQYNEKIPKYFPDKIKVAHKTGEITGVRHNVGIVFSKEPYILSILTKNSKDKYAVDEAISQIALKTLRFLN